MNETMDNIGRRLPSADWLAFGLAVVFSAFWMHILVPVAVFLPSLLRELGLLKDGDEYTRRVMYRAGFHALLVSALLVFATWAAAIPTGTHYTGSLLTGETLRKIIMYTFVVSYLLQYWGSREGSFRILLGMSLWILLPLSRMLVASQFFPAGYGWGVVAISASIAGLAFLVRRWPRLGGVLLLVVFVFAVVAGWGLLGTPDAAWSILLQACILPGAMGVALLRGSGPQEDVS